ncbi:MAG: hemolysin family protein [Chloroflexota bacterium]
MDESGLYLSIIGVLLVVDVLLTLSYAALQNSRQSELQEMADNNRGFAKTALTLLDAKSQLYITYTLSSLLIAVGIALASIFWLVVPAVSGTLALSTPLAVGTVFLISLVALILGTILPEAVGSAYAMNLLPVMTGFMRLVLVILSPLTRILLALSTLLARLFGSDQLVNTVTEEEIMTLVNAGNSGGTIEDEEREMIFSILQLDETYAREIMVPRIDIQAIEADTVLSEALDAFLRTGFSRIPVFEENIDKVIGLLYAKDLLNLWHNGGLEGHTVRELVRTAHFVPETRPADDLLRDLQSRKIHMAIVVDEYGGTSGLVTIENIMEEIVGDIQDEYDVNEETEYTMLGDNYIIDAGMDVDDVNELLGTSINPEDSDTLGGYIFLQIGRVPIVGEVVDSEELTMTVRSIDGRRIRKVLVEVKQPLPEDGGDAPENEQSDVPADEVSEDSMETEPSIASTLESESDDEPRLADAS